MSEETYGVCERGCGEWLYGEWVREVGGGSGGFSVVSGHVDCPGPPKPGDHSQPRSYPTPPLGSDPEIRRLAARSRPRRS